jgi:hypothetical protein
VAGPVRRSFSEGGCLPPPVRRRYLRAYKALFSKKVRFSLNILSKFGIIKIALKRAGFLAENRKF